MKNIIIYTILLFLVGCANIQPPSGGPPDETPPEIVETSPASGTVNFADDEIVVEFSEYVEQQSVIRSIVALPKFKTEYKWSGKKLRIVIDDSLDSDITYSVTFGTEYTDMRKNKPSESYTIIFSPGPKIDSGTINGKLYAKKADEYSIFAYNISKINPDTLNISKTQPDYLLPLGTNGSFSLMALKDGIYRLFCIKDTRSNGLYDINQDFFFAGSKDFIVKNAVSTFAEFKTPQFFDEIPIELSNAKAISDRIIEVSFNEPVDTSTVINEAFTLTDSSGNINESIEFAFLKPKEKSIVMVISKNILDTNKTYKIEAKNNGDFQIADTVGNTMNDSIRFSYFTPRTMATEIEPKVYNKPFNDSTDKVEINKKIEFIFTTAINFGDFSTEFIALEENEDIEYEIITKMNNKIEFKPKSLEDNKWYRIVLDTRNMTGFNGLPVTDSIIRLDFKTEDRRAYGGMNGAVKISDVVCNNPLLKIINKKEKFTAVQYLDSTNSFNFEDIPSGDYTFEIICDENRNMKVDAGYYFPFKYSEKFFIPINEVNVKSRWTIDDLMIYAGEQNK